MVQNNKAFVVIDIQNDITKHYRDIIDNINAAIEWAVEEGMQVVYIKHNNITAATRTFKPCTKGEELVPEMKVVSDNIFVKTKSNALQAKRFLLSLQRMASMSSTWLVRMLRPALNQRVSIWPKRASQYTSSPTASPVMT